MAYYVGHVSLLAVLGLSALPPARQSHSPAAMAVLAAYAAATVVVGVVKALAFRWPWIRIPPLFLSGIHAAAVVADAAWRQTLDSNSCVWSRVRDLAFAGGKLGPHRVRGRSSEVATFRMTCVHKRRSAQ